MFGALAFWTKGLRVLKHRDVQGTSGIDRDLRRLQGRLVIIL